MMEKLQKAIDLCAEIEAMQARLRSLLNDICDGAATDAESVDVGCTQSDSSTGCCRVEASASEVEADAREVVTASVAVKPRGDIRKAFTINDRFRFKRELFAGDDKALSAVIEHLATLDSLEQADAYLSTMPWDNECEAFNEFMTIISNHFNGFRG